MIKNIDSLLGIKMKQSEIIYELIQVLEKSIELLSLSENDFSWSSWENKECAVNEITDIIKSLKNGKVPDKISISILFAPTGPLQEVSLSSGWASEFLVLAEKYDKIERIL